jgi:hypothetical protein
VSDAMSPGIFESFNARALAPEQVAQTFVPPPHFHRLTKRVHSIIVGPRGSGKTTLLKMLQQPALEAWRHPDADSYRATIDFTGVFIATDVSWGRQIQSLGYGKLDPDTHRLFGIAAFTTHVLRSLIISMLYRVRPVDKSVCTPHRRVLLDEEGEAKLSVELAQVWKLSPTLPSLLSLKHALSARLLTIREQAGREAYEVSDGRLDRLRLVNFLHVHFIEAVVAGIELFDDATGGLGGRWALLFDELELAPAWIRHQLLQSLRSTDSRLLLKLSMSAYAEGLDEFDATLSATRDHDYDTIALWYAHKEMGYQFCRELWDAMVKHRKLGSISPEDLLGHSQFETTLEEWSDSGTAYAPGTRIGRRFIRMARNDRSFRRYLEGRGIDPRGLDKIQGDERAADLRKVASIVAVRDAFRTRDSSEGERRQNQRSRKNPDLYTGASALFAMVEGNPRWFIGIMSRLIGQLTMRDVEKTGVREIISRSKQAREIDGAASRFRALLKAIPCPAFAGGRRPTSLLWVLDAIGEYFFSAVVKGSFTPDPPGSFIIDSSDSMIPDEMHRSLTRALNSGAIVYVPDEDEQPLLSSLRGKRFRLSYLLAPKYRIPLRLGRGVALSKILKTKATPPRKVPPTPLFPEDCDENNS